DSRTENWDGTKMPVSSPNAATTDEQGNFELRVEAGIPHEFFISSPDYSGRGNRITPKPDESIQVRIAGKPRPVVARITGTVVDSDGHPIAGALANATNPTQPDAVLSDSDGHIDVPVRDLDKPFTMLISKVGYEMRNWNEIPP